MHEGRQESWWAHDAWVCHVIANCQRDPDSKPITPAQLDPMTMDEAGGSGGGIELTPETVRAIVAGMRAARQQ